MIPPSNRLFLIIFAVLFIAACNFPGTSTVASPTSLPEISPRPSEPGATFLPPVSKNKVIFVSPLDANRFLADQLERELETLTLAEGMRWERMQSISSEDIDPQTRIVIAFENDPGLRTLQIANPDVQFLAVAIHGLEAGSNLSIIGPEGLRIDQQAFIAGFLAAVITPDYRVGVISLADTIEGRAAQHGFFNGARYYCGLCRQAYPPFTDYPKHVQLPDSELDWQTVLDAAIQNHIETVYISSLPTSDSALVHLAQSRLRMLGGEPRPDNFPKELWVATVRMDPAYGLRVLWDDLLAGMPGVSMPMQLTIEEVNPALLTPGRQRLVEEIRDKILAGYIDTAVDPFTGDPR